MLFVFPPYPYLGAAQSVKVISYQITHTRMYWNSSTGDSDDDSRELLVKLLRGLYFFVTRSSLFRIATTILSSLPW